MRHAAAAAMLLADVAPLSPTIAQGAASSREIAVGQRQLGIATLTVTAHRTYGVLIQLDADHAGSAALIVHPRDATKWAQLSNATLVSLTRDSALVLPSLGDAAAALGAQAIDWDGRRFLALVFADAALRRRVAVEVGRDDLHWLVAALYDAAGRVRTAWDSDSTDRLSVFEHLLAIDAPPSGDGRPPPYPAALLGGPPRDGFAAVGVLVDSTGRVDPQSVDPIAASDPALMKAALAFVPHARFTPGRRLGRPAAMRWMFICEWRFGDPAAVRRWVEWVVQRNPK